MRTPRADPAVVTLSLRLEEVHDQLIGRSVKSLVIFMLTQLID